MRRQARLLLLSLFAATASTGAFAAEQAGVSAAVHGPIELVAATAPQAVGHQVRSGEKIFLGDRITSGNNAGMQIMLLDQTVFTIGPDSGLTIDRFVYDPASGTGKVSASITKGVFRFISGKVAHNNPSDMEVKVPGATIGIRGTSVIGRIDGPRIIIALLGPGPANNTGDKPAGVDVITGDGTGALRRPGWGVIYQPGQPPQVLQLPPQLMQSLLAALTPPPPKPLPAIPGAGGRQASTGPINAQTALITAGQLTAGAVQSLDSLLGNTTPVDSASGDVIATLLGTSLSFGDLTTLDQLLALALTTSGSANYAQTGVPLTDGVDFGTYDFSLTVNFGSRTISGSFSNILIGPVDAASLSLPTTSFAAGGAVPAIVSSTGTCTVVSCTGTAVILNSGSQIASSVLHTLTVTYDTSISPPPVLTTAAGAGIAPKL